MSVKSDVVDVLNQIFVIVIIGLKGGVGKSSFATEIAGCLAMQGVSVSILDTNPPQYSAASWAQIRNDRFEDTGEGCPVPYGTADVPNIVSKSKGRALSVFQNELANVGRGREVVVVDVGGVSDVTLPAAIGSADLIVSPLEPSSWADWADSDLATTVQSVWAYREVPMLGIFNKVHHHPVLGPQQLEAGRSAYTAADRLWGGPEDLAHLVEPSLRILAPWNRRHDGRTLAEVDPRGSAYAEWRAFWPLLAGAITDNGGPEVETTL